MFTYMGINFDIFYYYSAIDQVTIILCIIMLVVNVFECSYLHFCVCVCDCYCCCWNRDNVGVEYDSQYFCYVVVAGGGGLNVRICIFVFVLNIDFIVFVTVCYWDGDVVDQG